MRICCISDMHGQLHFSVKESDLLLIAGDILPAWDRQSSYAIQANFLLESFYPWVKEQPVKEVVMIAGNHDWIFDGMMRMVPPMPKNIHYLLDEDIEIMGLKIYGTPQQPIFNDWAFNQTPERLEMYYSQIPDGLDILLTHSAPYKIMDKVDFPNFKSHEGSKILKKRISEVKPKYVVFGHFHGQYGVEKKDYMGNITFVNCSLVNEAYEMVKKPIYLEL